MMIEEICGLDSPVLGSSFTEELFPQLDLNLFTSDDDIASKLIGKDKQGCLDLPWTNITDTVDDLADIDTDVLLAEWNNKSQDLSVLGYLLDKEEHDLYDQQSTPATTCNTQSLCQQIDTFAEFSPVPSLDGSTCLSGDFSLDLPEDSNHQAGNGCILPFTSPLEDSSNSVTSDLTESFTSQDETSSVISDATVDFTATGLLDALMSVDDSLKSSILIEKAERQQAVNLQAFISQQPLKSVVQSKSLVSPSSSKVSIVKGRNARVQPYDTNTCGERNPRRGGGRRKLPPNVKRERKKDQNRTAATRYRLKKKEEKYNIDEECDELEAYNTELKRNVESLEYEIRCMKNLLKEIPHLAEKAKSLGVTL